MTQQMQINKFYKPRIESSFKSKYKNINNFSIDEVFKFYDSINKDMTHMISQDDICTPMLCVKTMLDYIPEELWNRPHLKVLDPCAGNGNFGAYCKYKTSVDNIWYNEINPVRYENCKQILSIDKEHLTNCDVFDIDESNSKWDLIMANPPYSGGGNKNRGLSKNFIKKAVSLLNPTGYLCFVTPNNWMTYNNNNLTLKMLLTSGSFLVIDNDAKKFFPGVGSSFTIFVWQKSIFTNKTMIKNNYLCKDIQKDVIIPNNIPFIPLYISQTILNLLAKLVTVETNRFNYRCDLHNFTQNALLSDTKSDVFKYETIHTPRKTRYAVKKQDIFDKWTIIIPLSTYYIPYIRHNVNTTQSVGYIAFDDEQSAQNYLNIITQPQFKLIIHITRYGNFNNIMVLKHLAFDKPIIFTEQESQEIKKLVANMRY